MQNTDLRPLGAGELLDRAVTLYVRRFVVIVSALAIVVIPLLVVDVLFSPSSLRVSEDLMGLLQAGGNPAKVRAATAAMARDSHWTGSLLALTLGSIVVRLVMWNALLAVIASAYAGARTGLPEAYALAVRRWLPQLAVLMVWIVLGLIVAVPLVLLYVLIILAVIAVAFAHVTVLTVLVGLVLGLGFLALAVTVFAWVMMTYELATVAVVTETGNPIHAAETALRRGFAPTMRRRTVVGGLVLIVVLYGGSIPAAALGAIAAALTHQPLLNVAASGVASIVLEGLIAAFVVVFATDVRVRREGLDLAILAQGTP
ncbi:MAG TPA: hypothetical protein VE591_11805 [Candidatus Acidoferrum sp.]|nr:hypothetical protein [Candidatus Acidoferrum sp.]